MQPVPTALFFIKIRIQLLEQLKPIQTIESLKPQADDSIRIEVKLTAEQFHELEKAKNLLSHICPEGSWADVIGALAKNYNQKKLGKNRESPRLSYFTRMA